MRGLARAVERRGGRIVEGTAAASVGPRRVVTDRGVVTAATVVRATEAWSAHLAPRSVVPVYSLIVATRPLPAAFWERRGSRAARPSPTSATSSSTASAPPTTGWCSGAAGRRTTGARGSRRRSTPTSASSRGLRAAALDLFPALRADDFTHAWGGPLGIPRDWHAGVGLGPDGLGWAGGYVGDGVGTSHLAGRTLAALVLGRDDPVTRLPWVGHRSRRWEPEPLRWLLVNAGLRLMTLADEEERLTRRGSVIATTLSRALGG